MNMLDLIYRYDQWGMTQNHAGRRNNDRLDCNTPGVCHQLSNGFELKHDMSSGNEGVKIKST